MLYSQVTKMTTTPTNKDLLQQARLVVLNDLGLLTVMQLCINASNLDEINQFIGLNSDELFVTADEKIESVELSHSDIFTISEALRFLCEGEGEYGDESQEFEECDEEYEEELDGPNQLTVEGAFSDLVALTNRFNEFSETLYLIKMRDAVLAGKSELFNKAGDLFFSNVAGATSDSFEMIVEFFIKELFNQRFAAQKIYAGPNDLELN